MSRDEAFGAAMERAIVTGAVRVLDRHAAALRKKAGALSYTEQDKNNHTVTVLPGAAVVALRTAIDFEEIAAEITAMLPPDAQAAPT